MSRPDEVVPRRHHVLVQAEIEPLDADGIAAFAGGTAVFAVASVWTLLRRAELRAAGHEWWCWVALAGVATGLLALAYCWWRGRRRR